MVLTSVFLQYSRATTQSSIPERPFARVNLSPAVGTGVTPGLERPRERRQTASCGTGRLPSWVARSQQQGFPFVVGVLRWCGREGSGSLSLSGLSRCPAPPSRVPPSFGATVVAAELAGVGCPSVRP